MMSAYTKGMKDIYELFNTFANVKYIIVPGIGIAFNGAELHKFLFGSSITAESLTVKFIDGSESTYKLI